MDRTTRRCFLTQAPNLLDRPASVTNYGLDRMNAQGFSLVAGPVDARCVCVKGPGSLSDFNPDISYEALLAGGSPFHPRGYFVKCETFEVGESSPLAHVQSMKFGGQNFMRHKPGRLARDCASERMPKRESRFTRLMKLRRI